MPPSHNYIITGWLGLCPFYRSNSYAWQPHCKKSFAFLRIWHVSKNKDYLKACIFHFWIHVNFFKFCVQWIWLDRLSLVCGCCRFKKLPWWRGALSLNPFALNILFYLTSFIILSIWMRLHQLQMAQLVPDDSLTCFWHIKNIFCAAKCDIFHEG